MGGANYFLRLEIDFLKEKMKLSWRATISLHDTESIDKWKI
jgi:hypothetical protein